MINDRIQIFRLSLPGGELRQLTNDLNNYSSISLTADGKALAAIRSEREVGLWVAPAGHPEEAAPISARSGQDGGTFSVMWTPHGKLIHISTISDKPGLWLMEADGSDARPFPTDGCCRSYPRISADGRYIVFISSSSGSQDVFRMNAGGGVARQLTRDFNALDLDFSPLGWVIFSGAPVNDPERHGLWQAPIEGGAPTRLLRGEGGLLASPAVSPDGKLIAFFRLGDQAHAPIGVTPFKGGETLLTFAYPGAPSDLYNSRFLRWTADGSALTYPLTKDGATNIWSQPITGGQPKQLTRFQSNQIYSFDWAPDGRLAVARGAVRMNVVMIIGIR